MTPPRPHAAEATLGSIPRPVPHALKIPSYLEKVYWWAYVHPRAVKVFEREWLVNSILFGNYGRLRDAALAELGNPVHGRTLQVACVYGNLTPRLCKQLAPGARVDVVDILPIQIANLSKKIDADERVTLTQGDSSSLASPDATFDRVLMFFLLHEQPENVRRATMAEAVRVLKPGGKLVIVDYHRPKWWHPLRLLMRLVFLRLEPYAMDLWNNDLETFLPQATPVVLRNKSTWFGGLYQMLVLKR